MCYMVIICGSLIAAPVLVKILRIANFDNYMYRHFDKEIIFHHMEMFETHPDNPDISTKKGFNLTYIVKPPRRRKKCYTLEKWSERQSVVYKRNRRGNSNSYEKS